MKSFLKGLVVYVLALACIFGLSLIHGLTSTERTFRFVVAIIIGAVGVIMIAKGLFDGYRAFTNWMRERHGEQKLLLVKAGCFTLLGLIFTFLGVISLYDSNAPKIGAVFELVIALVQYASAWDSFSQSRKEQNNH